MRYNRTGTGQGERSDMARSTATSDVRVRLDDRARLMGAVLAAAGYPEQAQARKKHAVHAHARALHRRVAPLAAHPAVLAVAALLAQGMPVESLFAQALTLHPATLRPAVPMADLPPALAEGLPDFALQADLKTWWREEAESWQRAETESARALDGALLGPFLGAFFGPTTAQLTFIPNIGYPADAELALASGGELIAIVPPRPAWGDSPPWPFDEEPAHVLRAAIIAYSRLRLADPLRALSEQAAGPLPVSERFRALYPAWTDQFAQIVSAGLVTLYLEEHVSPQEAKAYQLLEKRLYGLDVLPSAVTALRDYRSTRQTGSAAALGNFLSSFAGLLRSG